MFSPQTTRRWRTLLGDDVVGRPWWKGEVTLITGGYSCYYRVCAKAWQWHSCHKLGGECRDPISVQGFAVWQIQSPEASLFHLVYGGCEMTLLKRKSVFTQRSITPTERFLRLDIRCHMVSHCQPLIFDPVRKCCDLSTRWFYLMHEWLFRDFYKRFFCHCSHWTDCRFKLNIEIFSNDKNVKKKFYLVCNENKCQWGSGWVVVKVCHQDSSNLVSVHDACF